MKTTGISFFKALGEDLIGKVKLGYEGFSRDCIEVVHIKRSRPPFFYSIEGEAEDVGFKVTMTKILPTRSCLNHSMHR